MEFGAFIKFDGIIPEGSVATTQSMVGFINWNQFVGIGVEENNVRAYAEITVDQAQQMVDWLNAFITTNKEN